MVNKHSDEPRSLLRRLLKQADQPAGIEPAPGAELPRAQVEASPIRPPVPSETPQPAQLNPMHLRATQTTSASRTTMTMTSPEKRLEAETALETLRKKTAFIANEFAEGKINRAQFSSMYAYYNEKRVIIERLLMRDPGTQAWQQVAQPGHTTFLRQHFEARVLAFGVYDIGKFEPIAAQGTVALPAETIQPVLTALYIVLRSRKDLKPLSRKIDAGRWLVIVPGRYTAAVALFSLEPAAQQVNLARDLHYDFERANRHALERGIRQPEQLVFPHRALFEQHSES